MTFRRRLTKFLHPLGVALVVTGGCAHQTQVNSAQGIGVSAQRALTFSFSADDGGDVSSALTEDLTETAEQMWRQWLSDFLSGPLNSPSEIKVRFRAVDGLAGRSQGREIEIGRRLSGRERVSVFRHELAHLFLSHTAQTGCHGDRPSEFYSEAFALWASQDESRLLSGFPYASQARDYLRDRAIREKLFHNAASAQALARLVAESRRLRPNGPESLGEFFRTSIKDCDFSHQVIADRLIGEKQKAPLSRESVLIVDGISGEKLKAAGEFRDARFPVASILKPALVAEFVELQRSQVSKSTLTWSCPEKAAGRPWVWSDALVYSCNGFFLDSDRPSRAALARFAQRLRLFGVLVSDDSTIEQLIGLHPGVEASPEAILAYYSWLSERAPEVIEALRGTASKGTLSRLPDSDWFARNQIALKSGTIRNAQGEPEHGWIVAIGPRGEAERPGFLAIVHQRGSSPQILLERLRAHLQDVLTAHPNVASAKVQILGLVPRASVSARCENLLLVLGQEPKSNSTIGFSALAEGTRIRCDRGPLWLKYPAPGGFQERAYWGQIEVSSPPAVVDSTEIVVGAPSPRQARARRGSELVLTTSERSYIAGVLASEFPDGRHETLKALALVVKFNLENAKRGRHLGRPICDTTHCQVFGPRNKDAGVAFGEKYSRIAQEISGQHLVGDLKEPWLMFAIGGERDWSVESSEGEIGRALGLSQAVYSIQRNLNQGTVQVTMGREGKGVRRVFQCEKFRNLLHLPSCPLVAEHSGATWTFKGRGAGHGFGIDLTRADRMAAEGLSSSQILKSFFPSLEIR